MNNKEKTTSEVLMEIGAHYLSNGCNGCDYLEIAKVCDAIPINCKYMALSFYFKGLEDMALAELKLLEKQGCKVKESDAE